MSVIIDGVEYVPASERDALRRELEGVMGEIQRLQPGGSPPPGGPAILARWIRLHVAQQLYGFRQAAAPRPEDAPAGTTHYSFDGGKVVFWRKTPGQEFTGLSRWWETRWVSQTGHLPWGELIPLHECQAVQYSDQMVCASCNLRWDVNDPHPPQCLRR